MRLHAPGFERKLRKEVKKAVRSSPGLKREYKRVNRSLRNRNVGFIFGPLLGVLLGFVVWNVTATTGHLSTGLAVINLWMLAAVFLQAQGIWARFYHSPDVVALLLLPATTERIFRWQLQKVLRYSLISLFQLSIGFGALAILYHFPPWKWVASMVMAFLSWATVLSISVFCISRFPIKPFQIIFAAIYILGLALIIGQKIIGHWVLQVLDQSAPTLNILLPTGWVPSSFQVLTTEDHWWCLILLLPLALILGTTRDSLKRLQKGLEYREHVMAQPSDLIPGEEIDAPLTRDKPLQLGPTAIEEIIQSRQFLALPSWPKRGWLEQKLWCWFSEREQALAEFVFPNGVTLTAPWLKVFRNLLIAAVLAYAAGLANPGWKWGFLILGFFITVCQALAQILSHGQAFQPWSLSGVNIPKYAGFGIGFHELSRTLLKCSVIQLPLLLLYCSAAGAMTAFLIEFPMGLGLMMGLKFGCLLFASRFIFLTLAFSSGTNDTSKFRFRTLLLVFLIIFLGLTFLGLGGTGLFLPNQVVSWLLCASAVFDAFLFFWVYSWFYNSGRFDLMSLPRNRP